MHQRYLQYCSFWEGFQPSLHQRQASHPQALIQNIEFEKTRIINGARKLAAHVSKSSDDAIVRAFLNMKQGKILVKSMRRALGDTKVFDNCADYVGMRIAAG